MVTEKLKYIYFLMIWVDSVLQGISWKQNIFNKCILNSFFF